MPALQCIVRQQRNTKFKPEKVPGGAVATVRLHRVECGLERFVIADEHNAAGEHDDGDCRHHPEVGPSRHVSCALPI